MQISGNFFFGMPLPGFGHYLQNDTICYIIKQISVIFPLFFRVVSPDPHGFLLAPTQSLKYN